MEAYRITVTQQLTYVSEVSDLSLVIGWLDCGLFNDALSTAETIYRRMRLGNGYG